MLAEVIRQRIIDGTYPVDSRIPAELDLMEESEYSRDTVRSAVKMLVGEGWLRISRGLGTYVNRPEERKTP